MVFILHESPQSSPTPEHANQTESTESNLPWLQHPVAQDALRWCLQIPGKIEDVAGYLEYRSNVILKTAEELKQKSFTGEATQEEAAEHFFIGKVLSGVGDIITQRGDLNWLKALMEQDEDNGVTTAEAEVDELDSTLQTVDAEPTSAEISLTDQVIQTIVLNGGPGVYGIEARVESVSAFRNGWVMGIVKELMDSADTIGKDVAVDKLDELILKFSSEFKLNRERIDNDNGSFTLHEIEVIKQANVILKVAERVFRDLAARINRTGNIKKSVAAVMEDEVDELRNQARAILEGPAHTTKQEMDWANQTFEVLKAGASEETLSGTDSTQRHAMGEYTTEPLAADEDNVTQPGVTERTGDITSVRPVPTEHPTFVRSITSGGRPRQPDVAAHATDAVKHEVPETRIGSFEAPGVKLTPKVRENLINIAMALGDKEAEKIARQALHSPEELKMLQAMTRKAHELKEQEESSRQDARFPDGIDQENRLGNHISPLRRKDA